MFYGKVIGGVLGFLAAGWLGLFVGIVAGHFFDKALKVHFTVLTSDEQQRLREQFFRVVFLLMGKLAKADGRVSEQEIEAAESLMKRMGLTEAHRSEAIGIFKEGVAHAGPVEALLNTFAADTVRYPSLRLTLIEYLTVMALADNELHDTEREVLFTVANALHIPRRQFELLLSMLLAQEQFKQQYQQGNDGGESYQRQPPRANELALAYQALGVAETVSDAELKKAYRKLISQHHPDKLIAQGVPDDMLKLATEKAQEIQAAYDLITKARGR